MQSARRIQLISGVLLLKTAHAEWCMPAITIPWNYVQQGRPDNQITNFDKISNLTKFQKAADA